MGDQIDQMTSISLIVDHVASEIISGFNKCFMLGVVLLSPSKMRALGYPQWCTLIYSNENKKVSAKFGVVIFSMR